MNTSTQSPATINPAASARFGVTSPACATAPLKLKSLSSALKGKNSRTRPIRIASVTTMPRLIVRSCPVRVQRYLHKSFCPAGTTPLRKRYPGILREGKPTVNDQHYDAIIIGSGPGGGTMAWRLAQTGKRILLLERGDYLPRERENWDTQAVFMDARYQTDEYWYGSDGRSFHPGLHYFVGGNSKVYGAVLLRLRERDFDEIRHPDGISPDWPLKYDAFEPYYQAAEELYHVHGLRGEDPTEPPSRLPYAFPPLTHEPRIQQLFDGLKREGHHPFHLPVGILLDEEGDKALPHSPCIRCNAFDGYPCLTNGKADSQIICVDPALKAHANLTLRTANDDPPNGLANGSGLVGRNYMQHNNTTILAISRTPNPTRFQKTLGLNDFYFGSEDWEFPLGHIQMVGKSDGAQIHGEGLPDFLQWFPN